MRPGKLRRGWLSGVRDRWDARNIAAKDSDEWFGREREWSAAYNTHIKYNSEAVRPVCGGG